MLSDPINLADGFVEPQFKWYKKYGNIVKYYGIFNKPTIFVADPKIIQEITFSRSYDFIKPYSTSNKSAIALLGKGLIFAEGDDHKRQRKMMNPAFSHSNIKGMVPDFIRVTTSLIDLIKEEINQGNSNVNLTPYISKATLDIIGLTYSNRCNLRYKEACVVIHRESKKLIDAKFKEAENGELKNKDLLSLLINNNKTLPDEEKLTYDELKNQIMTFLVAGHETTNVTTSSWALYLLAHHPHHQDLLREELGTEIQVGSIVVQKSAEFWGPTAEEFDPKRWLDSDLMKKINNYNYLPFLNGARGCIGNKVASAEAKIMLAILIMNFVFKPIEGLQIKRRVLFTPKVDPYLGLDVSNS
ncbi:cytochrome P450 [Rhizophagus diaphanus]|nr:cytochrome P450 [Rhizophagus diaphanus] [Rhizophagus sp. MUCL 43196]